jgi:hypothetical protein
MKQVPLLDSGDPHGHCGLLQVDLDRAECSLDQQVMLRPSERRPVLESGVGVICELEGDQQHVVLVAELRA